MSRMSWVTGAAAGVSSPRAAGRHAADRAWLLLAAVAFGAGGLSARPDKLTIALRYVPAPKITSVRIAGDTGMFSIPLSVTLVEPIGGGTAVVGENREHSAPVPVVSSAPVGGFVLKALLTTMGGWGVRTVSSSALSLEVEVARLFVAETHRYHGEARLRFTLKNQKGEAVWEGTKVGTSKRFGRSLSEDNYCESISDSLAEAFNALIADESFRAAWAGRRVSPAPGRPAGLAGDPPEVSRAGEGVTPAELKTKLIALRAEGFDSQMQQAYVRQVALRSPLTAEDMIEWRRAGIPDEVLREALARKAEAAPR